MGNIRIESDGTAPGTKLIDMYTGEQINGALSLQVNIDVDKGVIAIITLIPKEINMTIKEDDTDIIYEELTPTMFDEGFIDELAKEPD